mmetsp:Transcript_3320/g.7788  ORF Transcript_3320/g.7788 Transcript_3320/m.7788 type:complete len:1090 (+) Transcript_3320:210-3479(+)
MISRTRALAAAAGRFGLVLRLLIVALFWCLLVVRAYPTLNTGPQPGGEVEEEGGHQAAKICESGNAQCQLSGNAGAYHGGADSDVSSGSEDVPDGNGDGSGGAEIEGADPEKETAAITADTPLHKAAEALMDSIDEFKGLDENRRRELISLYLKGANEKRLKATDHDENFNVKVGIKSTDDAGVDSDETGLTEYELDELDEYYRENGYAADAHGSTDVGGTETALGDGSGDGPSGSNYYANKYTQTDPRKTLEDGTDETAAENIGDNTADSSKDEESVKIRGSGLSPDALEARLKVLGVNRPPHKIKINVGQKRPKSSGSSGTGGSSSSATTTNSNGNDNTEPESSPSSERAGEAGLETTTTISGEPPDTKLQGILEWYRNVCFKDRLRSSDISQQEYRFSVCLFDKIVQKENKKSSFSKREYSLGNWAGFVGCDDFDRDNEPDEIEKSDLLVHNHYRICMKFDQGDKCPGDVKRSTIVSVGCGITQTVYMVREPHTCDYRMRLDLPILCPRVLDATHHISTKPIRLSRNYYHLYDIYDMLVNVVFYVSLTLTIYMLIGPILWDYGGEDVYFTYLVPWIRWLFLLDQLPEHGRPAEDDQSDSDDKDEDHKDEDHKDGGNNEDGKGSTEPKDSQEVMEKGAQAQNKICENAGRTSDENHDDAANIARGTEDNKSSHRIDTSLDQSETQFAPLKKNSKSDCEQQTERDNSNASPRQRGNDSSCNTDLLHPVETSCDTDCMPSFETSKCDANDEGEETLERDVQSCSDRKVQDDKDGGIKGSFTVLGHFYQQIADMIHQTLHPEPMTFYDLVYTILVAMAISAIIRRLWPIIYYDYLFPPEPIPIPSKLEIERFMQYVDTDEDGELSRGELSGYMTTIDQYVRMGELETLWYAVDSIFKSIFEEGELCRLEDVEEVIEELEMEDFRDDWVLRFEFADEWGNKDSQLDVDETLVMILPDLVPSSREKWWREVEFRLADKDANKRISWKEYLKHMVSYHKYVLDEESEKEILLKENKLLWFFCDEDGSKDLDKKEYVRFNQLEWSHHHTTLAMEHDENGSGSLSKKEITENLHHFKKVIHQHFSIIQKAKKKER